MIDLEELARNPWKFDFFEVLRAFEREYHLKPRIGDNAARDEEILLLGQDPYVEFPASNISRFERDGRGRFRLYSKFLGLLGPQGALPLHTTLEAKLFQESGDDAFIKFLDLFNHRFLQLFFRVWSDARPTGQHDRAGEDHFAEYVGSTVGIGSPPYRRRDSLPDLSKLALAGLLGPAVKSASRVESMLEHVFGVKTEVRQMIGTWLKLEKADQTALGGANAGLGLEAMMGSSVYTVQDKFQIRLTVDGLAQFEQFLPGGGYFDKLVDLIYFYIGDLLEYEVRLLLPAEDAEPVKLGSFGRLGWTTWMRDDAAHPPQPLLDDCSFHPAEMAAEKRRQPTQTPSPGEH